MIVTNPKAENKILEICLAQFVSEKEKS